MYVYLSEKNKIYIFIYFYKNVIMYSYGPLHIEKQVLGKQLELIYNSSVHIDLPEVMNEW